jgi:hypothetical protein
MKMYRENSIFEYEGGFINKLIKGILIAYKGSIIDKK